MHHRLQHGLTHQRTDVEPGSPGPVLEFKAEGERGIAIMLAGTDIRSVAVDIEAVTADTALHAATNHRHREEDVGREPPVTTVEAPRQPDQPGQQIAVGAVVDGTRGAADAPLRSR